MKARHPRATRRGVHRNLQSPLGTAGNAHGNAARTGNPGTILPLIGQVRVEDSLLRSGERETEGGVVAESGLLCTERSQTLPLGYDKSHLELSGTGRTGETVNPLLATGSNEGDSRWN